MIAQFSRHLMDNFLENHRVNVLAQHVQQEKVPHLGLLDDDVDALLLDQPEPDVQKVGLKVENSINLALSYAGFDQLIKTSAKM